MTQRSSQSSKKTLPRTNVCHRSAESYGMWTFPRPVPMLLHSSTVNKLSHLDGTKVKQTIMIDRRYLATLPGLARSVNTPENILQLYIKLKKHPNWGLSRAWHYQTSQFILPSILFLCVIFVQNFLIKVFFLCVIPLPLQKKNLSRQGECHRDLLFLGLKLTYLQWANSFCLVLLHHYLLPRSKHPCWQKSP